MRGFTRSAPLGELEGPIRAAPDNNKKIADGDGESKVGSNKRSLRSNKKLTHQFVQTVAAVSAMYLPASHLLQSSAPRSCMYFPGLQSVQLVAPRVSIYFPV